MCKRALCNKKGFTLVELMIVVIIMGILVAVAIPIYTSVTKGAEKNACHTNCEIIEKAAVQYYLHQEHGTAESITGGADSIVITSSEDAKAKLPADFLKCFNDSVFPQCPSEDCVYVLYANADNNGITVRAYCSAHGNAAGEMHE